MTIDTLHPDNARKSPRTATTDLSGRFSWDLGRSPPSGLKNPSRLAGMGLGALSEAMHGAGPRDTTDLDTLDLTPAEALVEVDRLRDATGRQVRAIVSLTIRLADVEAERDAAAENARQSRDETDAMRVASMERVVGRNLGGTPGQFERMSADPVEYLREAFDDTAYRDLPAYTSDAVSRVLAMLATLTTDLIVARADHATLSAAYDKLGRYTDAQREAAATALRQIAARGHIADPNAYAGTSTDGERYGRTVDAVAKAFGMERAS